MVDHGAERDWSSFLLDIRESLKVVMEFGSKEKNLILRRIEKIYVQR